MSDVRFQKLTLSAAVDFCKSKGGRLYEPKGTDYNLAAIAYHFRHFGHDKYWLGLDDSGNRTRHNLNIFNIAELTLNVQFLIPMRI